MSQKREEVHHPSENGKIRIPTSKSNSSTNLPTAAIEFGESDSIDSPGSAKKRVSFKMPIKRSDTVETCDSNSQNPDQTDDSPKKVTNYFIRSNNSLLSMDAMYSVQDYEAPTKHHPIRSKSAPDLNPRILEHKTSETSVETAGKAVVESVYKVDHEFAKVLAKFVILQSRSSGTDKLASFFQYGAMAYGDVYLRFVRGLHHFRAHGNIDPSMAFRIMFGQVAPFKDTESRWWFLLEDSMSSGRKVLRLGKWMKEIERARLALTVPHTFLGYARTSFMRVLIRSITVVAHLFAAAYYLYDNLVWATQIGIVNSGFKQTERELLRIYKDELKFEDYKEYSKKYQSYVKSRVDTEKRIERWKDVRNYASLYRLILSVLNSSLRISSLNSEMKRLSVKYEHRLIVSEEIHASRHKSTDVLVKDLNEKLDKMKFKVSEKGDSLMEVKSPSVLRHERDSRISKIREAKEEEIDDLTVGVCNLLMVLSRLRFRYFKEMPLYMVGTLGVVVGAIGILKNWPRKVPSKAPPSEEKKN